jgi:hypothetical protein
VRANHRTSGDERETMKEGKGKERREGRMTKGSSLFRPLKKSFGRLCERSEAIYH